MLSFCWAQAHSNSAQCEGPIARPSSKDPCLPTFSVVAFSFFFLCRFIPYVRPCKLQPFSSAFSHAVVQIVPSPSVTSPHLSIASASPRATPDQSLYPEITLKPSPAIVNHITASTRMVQLLNSLLPCGTLPAWPLHADASPT